MMEKRAYILDDIMGAIAASAASRLAHQEPEKRSRLTPVIQIYTK